MGPKIKFTRANTDKNWVVEVDFVWLFIMKFDNLEYLMLTIII